MHRLLLVFIVILGFLAGAFGSYFLLSSDREKFASLNEFRQLMIDATYAKIEGIKEFGPLELGKQLPRTANSGIMSVSRQSAEVKFYVYIVKKNFVCTNDNCGIYGALTRTMGGQLEGARLNDRQSFEEFGFDEEYGRLDIYESLVIVANESKEIVGLYPNKDIDDVVIVLKQFPDLANFDLLKGESEFGPLRLGEYAPFRPGDKVEDNRRNTMVSNIATDQRFYVYALHKEFSDMGFCYSFQCYGIDDTDHTRDDNYNGWFSGHGDPLTLMRFGLDPQKIQNGEQSLVVVTDRIGKIRALHPGKDKYDVLSILWQLPEYIDVKIAAGG